MKIDMPKKYVASESEAKWIEYWKENNFYKFDKDSKDNIFSIDTPPPYASADHLHVGHGMHYSQFEFIARYQRMNGKNVFFPMGYDDNGLPTERFVEAKYKIDKSKTTRKDFIKLCLEETKKTGKTYYDLFNRLGFSIDWDLLYQTIGPNARRVAQKSFLELYKKGRLERVDLPSMWCTTCQTNLAQADLDNLEFESKFSDVTFSSKGKELIISTTRPELIPACVALAYNPQDKRYLELKGEFAKVPLFDYEVPIVADDTVDLEKGTGLMMVCTFGDKEDIEKWHKHKLPLRLVFSETGEMNDYAGEFKGLTLKKARTAILEKLNESGLLKNQKEIVHAVNVHERCQTEIEFLKKPQWQIKVLDKKEELIEMGKKVNWYPSHMRTRFEHWINNLGWNWAISRQRYYGVPFPVWYCQDCNIIILGDESKFPIDPREEKYEGKCECGSSNIVPEMDVMDTWMISSNTPEINANWSSDKEINGFLPMSLRAQAHDIIRTWAFYTIVKSYFHHGEVPWKDIMISGHGQDPHGHKMSKSKGNFVVAQDVIEKYGSDSFRLWSATSKLGEDLRYREEDVKSAQKTITKLWNATKFGYMHLEDYDVAGKKYDPEKLELMDRWLLIKLNGVINNATDGFEVYEFSKAKKEVEHFFWNTLCDNYLEIAKDRLYNPDTRGELQRLSGQYALHTALLDVLKIFAPIAPFITEELYSYHFAKIENKKSIHVSDWPVADVSIDDENIEKIGDRFVEILSEVRGFKSENGKSLKEQVKIVLTQEDFDLISKCIGDFKASTQAKEVIVGTEFSVSF
jgi:valyl-tRNA synthetase